MVVPHPSEAFTSVMEPGGVEAACSVPARLLSKSVRTSRTWAKALTAANENRAIRRVQFMRITVSLDLAAGVPGTNNFSRSSNHFRVPVPVKIQGQCGFLTSLRCPAA